MDEYEKELRICFGKMPKLELHAHLNGSLSEETLKKLILLKKKKSGDEILEIPRLKSNDLSECFQVFGLIHKITDTPEAVYMATCDVIEDFHKDGVLYLELRTTPKEVGSQMTQEIYVESVLKAIQDTCSNSCPNMCVNLLLSIDRKRPLSAAEEMIKIAEKYFSMSSSVVGIDLSGDPQCGDISSFIPLLEHAKKVGLKLAIHISEIPERFEEVEKLLRLRPHRLGHGTYLHPSKGGSSENFKLLKQLEIPLEICMTSNIISKTVPTYQDHHFKLFMNTHPCVLCTDDKGIFNTTLSNEYYLASKYFSLSSEDLYSLSWKSIDYIFGNDNLKQNLRSNFREIYGNLSSSNIL